MPSGAIAMLGWLKSGWAGDAHTHRAAPFSKSNLYRLGEPTELMVGSSPSASDVAGVWWTPTAWSLAQEPSTSSGLPCTVVCRFSCGTPQGKSLSEVEQSMCATSLACSRIWSACWWHRASFDRSAHAVWERCVGSEDSWKRK
ncbi:hypothetical protein EX30DRAFT_124477 [Ascodesmis nigricans]|uniref:Uncharacterized protein n=1 Tax=Ascodesmis nigricans TaxID=341454 RepID=A0A4S2MRT7_9PEZI|nr:hypothetical protein EX30DRAFT_124477 [Ascodesmis nigricans]